MSVREMMPPLRTLSALSDCSDADRDALLSEEKRRLIAAERRFKERRRPVLTRTSPEPPYCTYGPRVLASYAPYRRRRAACPGAASGRASLARAV